MLGERGNTMNEQSIKTSRIETTTGCDLIVMVCGDTTACETHTVKNAPQSFQSVWVKNNEKGENS